MIVPGGGLSRDGKAWVPCRPHFFLSVRVLSRLFRRLFLEKLLAAHEAGELRFFNEHAALAESTAFKRTLDPLRKTEWVVYAKRPFAGPAAVLAYLSRYTHRVAISNSRLIRLGHNGVTFRWKDYRLKGSARYTTMTLPTQEFIRRFLIHVLPKGFHRIRHYGLLAKGQRAANLARARQLLAGPGHDQAADTASPDQPDEPNPYPRPCPKCGGPMVVIETFGPDQTPLRPHAHDPPPAKAEAA
jgi:hypothetical protein